MSQNLDDTSLYHAGFCALCIYNSKIVYRSLTRQNRMCELGWFSLGRLHN